MSPNIELTGFLLANYSKKISKISKPQDKTLIWRIQNSMNSYRFSLVH